MKNEINEINEDVYMAGETPALHASAGEMAALHGENALHGKSASQGVKTVHGGKAVLCEFMRAIDNRTALFYNPDAETTINHHKLPHWGQDRTAIFVTFRLWDSLPENVLGRYRYEREEWLENHPKPWSQEVEREYYALTSGRVERFLDAGHGSCLLSREDCSRIVCDALEFFNGRRYTLFSYVVMPNHVHVLLELHSGEDLPKILHSWKSWTAKKLNALLGKAGSVWQNEYFDRVVRSLTHFNRCLAYIRKNAYSMEKVQG